MRAALSTKLCHLGIYTLVLLALSNNSVAEQCLNFKVIHNAPIGYLDSDNQPTGTHWDYLEAIAEHSGLCINLKLLPYARLWRSIETGTSDGAIVFRSADRQHLVNYVALIRTLKTVVIPRSDVKLESYQDLAGLTIGKTRGTRLSDRFDRDLSLHTVLLNGYKQAAGMFAAKRIDAIAGSEVVLSYQLNRYAGIKMFNIPSRLVLGSREQWLQLSKHSKQQHKIALLQKTIAELQAQGVFDQIMSKHYGDDWKALNQ